MADVLKDVVNLIYGEGVETAYDGFVTTGDLPRTEQELMDYGEDFKACIDQLIYERINFDSEKYLGDNGRRFLELIGGWKDAVVLENSHGHISYYKSLFYETNDWKHQRFNSVSNYNADYTWNNLTNKLIRGDKTIVEITDKLYSTCRQAELSIKSALLNPFWLKPRRSTKTLTDCCIFDFGSGKGKGEVIYGLEELGTHASRLLCSNYTVSVEFKKVDATDTLSRYNHLLNIADSKKEELVFSEFVELYILQEIMEEHPNKALHCHSFFIPVLNFYPIEDRIKSLLNVDTRIDTNSLSGVAYSHQIMVDMTNLLVYIKLPPIELRTVLNNIDNNSRAIMKNLIGIKTETATSKRHEFVVTCKDQNNDRYYTMMFGELTEIPKEIGDVNKPTLTYIDENTEFTVEQEDFYKYGIFKLHEGNTLLTVNSVTVGAIGKEFYNIRTPEKIEGTITYHEASPSEDGDKVTSDHVPCSSVEFDGLGSVKKTLAFF